MPANLSYSKKQLELIWKKPPVDYYQKGIRDNLLQRLWHLGKLKTILDLINRYHKRPKNILDVGCASGWFLNQISKNFPQARCTGIDIYRATINYGQKRYPNLHLVYGDAHKLPFADRTFGLVICTEVLEHLMKPIKVVREIERILKDNGIVIIEMDSGNFLFKLVWYWWTTIRSGVWENAHLHFFNPKKLNHTIQKGGLKVISKKTFNFSMAVAFVGKKK